MALSGEWFSGSRGFGKAGSGNEYTGSWDPRFWGGITESLFLTLVNIHLHSEKEIWFPSGHSFQRHSKRQLIRYWKLSMYGNHLSFQWSFFCKASYFTIINCKIIQKYNIYLICWSLNKVKHKYHAVLFVCSWKENSSDIAGMTN